MVELNQYLRAVTLRQHLDKAKTRLSTQSFSFWDAEYYDCLGYTVRAIQEYGSAVHEWKVVLSSPYLESACMRFDEPHYHFVFQLARCLSGDFDQQTLDVVHEKHLEAIHFVNESPMWYVTVAFWMIEESINRTTTFQKSVNISEKCDLFNVRHQRLINVYLINIVNEAIETCLTMEAEYRDSTCMFEDESIEADGESINKRSTG